MSTSARNPAPPTQLGRKEAGQLLLALLLGSVAAWLMFGPR